LIVPARDVLHVKLATPRHPLIGETWLSSLTPEFATRNAINNAAATFANNMSRPSGVLTTDLPLKTAERDALRETWNQQSKGLNAGGVPILSYGLKFQPISISNEDAQVIEQLKLNDRAIASVFGVPVILLGMTDTATQKSAEALMAEWLASGLGFVLNHIEVAFDKLFGLAAVPAGREWSEFDTRALLRSMFKDQIDGLARSVQAGIHAPNDARRIMGLAAAENGDEPRVQQQMVPLSFEPAPPAPPPAAAVLPALPAEDQDKPEEEQDDEDATGRALMQTRGYRDERLRHAA